MPLTAQRWVLPPDAAHSRVWPESPDGTAVAMGRGMPSHHELRRSKRLSAYITVSWQRRDGGGDFTIEVKATDLNADGLFLKTSEPVERGSRLQLRLHLPDHELPVLGTAVHVGQTASGQGIGVEFYMMSSYTRLSWLRYYHALLDADLGGVSIAGPAPAAERV
jgi:hypothetical protein